LHLAEIEFQTRHADQPLQVPAAEPETHAAERRQLGGLVGQDGNERVDLVLREAPARQRLAEGRAARARREVAGTIEVELKQIVERLLVAFALDERRAERRAHLLRGGQAHRYHRLRGVERLTRRDAYPVSAK